jgi:hypothetical protein
MYLGIVKNSIIGLQLPVALNIKRLYPKCLGIEEFQDRKNYCTFPLRGNNYGMCVARISGDIKIRIGLCNSILMLNNKLLLWLWYLQLLFRKSS